MRARVEKRSVLGWNKSKETVRGKSRTLNHVSNVEIRSRRNPEYRPIRWYNRNVKIVREKSPEDHILQIDPPETSHDGHTNIKRSSLCRTNRQTSSTTVIPMSNESANIKHDGNFYVKQIDKHHRYVKKIDEHNLYVKRITKTLKESRSCICTHNPLRAYKPYMYAKAALRAKDVFVRTSRLERKRRIRTQKPLTLRKVVHIRTQKQYNLRKASYIAQIRTRTYVKAV